jgi:hypothetical protein
LQCLHILILNLDNLNIRKLNITNNQIILLAPVSFNEETTGYFFDEINSKLIISDIVTSKVDITTKTITDTFK